MREGRGRLLVLEGGEGVGKTTQWERVGAALRADGHDVVAVREPGGTAAGDRVRALLLDPEAALAPEAEALLFAASRAQLVREVVRPALARGAVVLVDRFLLSTYAYQGAGRGIPVPALRAINAVATDGLVPDRTLVLRLPLPHALDRARARGGADRMEREDLAFHARVEAAFAEALHPAWQAAHPEVGPVTGVDASGTPDEVTARCRRALEGVVPVNVDAMAAGAASRA
ncbi:MAG: dTMP kinase [Gemmatimonadetes bacterium]|nr:dTMP kinase [Gemmatimonadota bacterium]